MVKAKVEHLHHVGELLRLSSQGGMSITEKDANATDSVIITEEIVEPIPTLANKVNRSRKLSPVHDLEQAQQAVAEILEDQQQVQDDLLPFEPPHEPQPVAN